MEVYISVLTRHADRNDLLRRQLTFVPLFFCAFEQGSQVLFAYPHGPSDAVVGKIAIFDLATDSASGYSLSAGDLVDRKELSMAVAQLYLLIQGWALWSGRRSRAHLKRHIGERHCEPRGARALESPLARCWRPIASDLG